MIDKKYQQQAAVQNYQLKQEIEGVELVKSNLFATADGNFAEILRYNEGQIPGIEQDVVIRQLNWSYIMPQTIKAYHYHLHQKDVWFCPPVDRLLVNLHDLRQDSPTFDHHATYVLGAGLNTILVIPEGVAHGCANLYHRPMSLFYAVTQQFDPQNPDEHRLPWDLFGAERWELEKG